MVKPQRSVVIASSKIGAPTERTVDIDEMVLHFDTPLPDLAVFDLPRRRPRHALAPHPSFWRWVEFDPPMRDPGTALLEPRKVRCRVCDVVLGVTCDPVDALAIARRHRRQLRQTA